jgi:RNA-directed DNA polymerase
MVATLERGIKGGKWFSLVDKVWKMENLQSAAAKVQANGGAAGVDGLSCEDYLKDSALRLRRLQAELQQDSYRPHPVKRVWIPKLGSKELRPLGVPTVEDRVVETALRNVIEPIFENMFAEHSYGFRPGRGAKDALRRVDQLLKAGKVWVVDADLKAYFDTIPHEPLMRLVEERIADSRVLEMIRKMLKQGVMETAKAWQPTEQGTPQGAVISPLLANLYLNPLDHLMVRLGKEMVRYADDFVILCESQAEAQAVLEQVRQWTAAAGLTLHPVKTRLVDASQRGGFDFLGYHFERGHRWPRDKSRAKFRETIRQKIRRRDPRPMSQIIAEVNRTLRGWFNYFQHSVLNVFAPEDRWVRQRLRTMLRRRHKGQGRARGRDHQRWPNAYFADLGLFSLAIARAQASHVRYRTH